MNNDNNNDNIQYLQNNINHQNNDQIGGNYPAKYKQE